MGAGEIILFSSLKKRNFLVFVIWKLFASCSQIVFLQKTVYFLFQFYWRVFVSTCNLTFSFGKEIIIQLSMSARIQRTWNRTRKKKWIRRLKTRMLSTRLSMFWTKINFQIKSNTFAMTRQPLSTLSKNLWTSTDSLKWLRSCDRTWTRKSSSLTTVMYSHTSKTALLKTSPLHAIPPDLLKFLLEKHFQAEFEAFKPVDRQCWMKKSQTVPRNLSATTSNFCTVHATRRFPSTRWARRTARSVGKHSTRRTVSWCFLWKTFSYRSCLTQR